MNYRVYKKIVYFFSILFLINQTAYSQDEEDNWVVGLGVNAIDIRTPASIVGFAKDYLNGSIEDLNMNGAFIRVFVGRHIKNDISILLSASANTVTKGFGYSTGADLIDDSFFALDAKARYDLNRLIGQSPWLDPYVLAGGGYSKLGDINNFNLAAGWGCNFWFSRSVGINVQSDYNHNPASTATDYFQHSIGIVFKLNSSPRFRWRGR
jgi:hypothetical protein